MEHATQVALIERVLANIGRNTTDMAEPSVSPVARYLSPDRFAREQAVLFRRFPVAVAFASQLAEPGAFVTHDKTGVPILVARDSDGSLNAFVNACRHRGTKLVSERHGQSRAFVCPYHAWTYGTDGRLRHVTHVEGFPHVNKDRCGLVRLPVAERAGLVWAVPDPGSDLDIVSYLGDLAGELESFGFGGHVLFGPHEDMRSANWKLSLDANLENYHVRIAHRDTIAHMFEDNVAVADRFGPHIRLLFPKRSMRSLKETDPADWDLRAHGNIIYYFFPGTLVLVEPDHAMVMNVFPDAIDRFRVEGGMLIPAPPATDKARRHWQKNHDIFWTALEEDFRMVERVQDGIRAGLIPQLHFARYEQCADWFHQTVEEALAAGR